MVNARFHLLCNVRECLGLEQIFYSMNAPVVYTLLLMMTWCMSASADEADDDFWELYAELFSCADGRRVKNYIPIESVLDPNAANVLLPYDEPEKVPDHVAENNATDRTQNQTANQEFFKNERETQNNASNETQNDARNLTRAKTESERLNYDITVTQNDAGILKNSKTERETQKYGTHKIATLVKNNKTAELTHKRNAALIANAETQATEKKQKNAQSIPRGLKKSINVLLADAEFGTQNEAKNVEGVNGPNIEYSVRKKDAAEKVMECERNPLEHKCKTLNQDNTDAKAVFQDSRKSEARCNFTREVGELLRTREESKRIVDGWNAAPGQYPWMARLAIRKDNFSEPFYGCGGSLISRRFVLTAAHCCEDQVVKVQLGEYDYSKDFTCKDDKCFAPQIIHVEKSIVHPLYHPKVVFNDIALLKLKQEAVYNEFVSPICLPHGSIASLSSGVAEAAGWGNVLHGSGVRLLPVLQSILLPFYPNSFCRSSILRPLLDQQFCAGGRGRQDTCAGDSGGPLMKVGYDNGSPQYFVIGVVSMGPRACGDGKLGLYTNVSSYSSWILRSVFQELGKLPKSGGRSAAMRLLTPTAGIQAGAVATLLLLVPLLWKFGDHHCLLLFR